MNVRVSQMTPSKVMHISLPDPVDISPGIWTDLTSPRCSAAMMSISQEHITKQSLLMVAVGSS